jgi:hypothetical protein
MLACPYSLLSFLFRILDSVEIVQQLKHMAKGILSFLTTLINGSFPQRRDDRSRRLQSF